jgi:hypothetical protein
MPRPKKVDTVSDVDTDTTADTPAVEFAPGDEISIERYEELLASGWTPPRGAAIDPMTKTVKL